MPYTSCHSKVKQFPSSTRTVTPSHLKARRASERLRSCLWRIMANGRARSLFFVLDKESKGEKERERQGEWGGEGGWGGGGERRDWKIDALLFFDLSTSHYELSFPWYYSNYQQPITHIHWHDRLKDDVSASVPSPLPFSSQTKKENLSAKKERLPTTTIFCCIVFVVSRTN